MMLVHASRGIYLSYALPAAQRRFPIIVAITICCTHNQIIHLARDLESSGFEVAIRFVSP